MMDGFMFIVWCGGLWCSRTVYRRSWWNSVSWPFDLGVSIADQLYRKTPRI